MKQSVKKLVKILEFNLNDLKIQELGAEPDEEGLFHYLQREKWLHPYTAIWKTIVEN